MYKLTLPQNCPVGGAEERDVALYRILHAGALTDIDLRSYFEENPDRYAGQCVAYGISLFEKREAAIRACQDAKTRGKFLGTYVGKVYVKPEHGKLHGKKGHYTLWLYPQVDAQKIACRDIEKVEV